MIQDLLHGLLLLVLAGSMLAYAKTGPGEHPVQKPNEDWQLQLADARLALGMDDERIEVRAREARLDLANQGLAIFEHDPLISSGGNTYRPGRILADLRRKKLILENLGLRDRAMGADRVVIDPGARAVELEGLDLRGRCPLKDARELLELRVRQLSIPPGTVAGLSQLQARLSASKETKTAGHPGQGVNTSLPLASFHLQAEGGQLIYTQFFLRVPLQKPHFSSKGLVIESDRARLSRDPLRLKFEGNIRVATSGGNANASSAWVDLEAGLARIDEHHYISLQP